MNQDAVVVIEQVRQIKLCDNTRETMMDCHILTTVMAFLLVECKAIEVRKQAEEWPVQ